MRYSDSGGLHRIGFSPQVAAHRAAERDEDAFAGRIRRLLAMAGRRDSEQGIPVPSPA